MLTLFGEVSLMKEQIRQILCECRQEGRSKAECAALVLPALQRIQRAFGYIPAAAIPLVSRLARVSESHVYGVASFYEQFSLTPIGRHVVTVCRGTACHVKGSGSLLDDLCAKLGVGPDETTADGQFTLRTVACFGSCALAPVAVIDGKVYGRVTRAKMLQLIDKLAAPELVEAAI